MAYQAAYAQFMWRVYVRQHPTMGPWVTRLESKPNWVLKAALLAAVLIVVIPLALLAMAAVLVGLIIFVVLGAIATVVTAVRRLFTSASGSMGHVNASTDGRDNVRVIHDERPQ